jgi:hypothetical protein
MNALTNPENDSKGNRILFAPFALFAANSPNPNLFTL